MKIAPSIIAANFTRLKEELKMVERAGADLIHLDIMDGCFVPNITFGPLLIEAIRRITRLPLDVHLMILNPERYLNEFINAGSNWISFHAEATKKAKECIRYIKNRRKKVGLAINPETPFKDVVKYIEDLDFILIMSVHPGFYGQKFIPEILKKIETAKNYITKLGLSCLIQVDGGINGKNANLVRRAGADILVAGAGIFKQKDYKKAIRDLRCLKV